MLRPAYLLDKSGGHGSHNCWSVGFELKKVSCSTYTWSQRDGDHSRGLRWHTECAISYGSGAWGLGETKRSIVRRCIVLHVDGGHHAPLPHDVPGGCTTLLLGRRAGMSSVGLHDGRVQSGDQEPAPVLLPD